MLHVVWVHGQVQIQGVSQELVGLIGAFPGKQKQAKAKVMLSFKFMELVDQG